MNDAARTNHDRHAILDSSITSLLPLALPPHAADPTLFVLGILPFAQIFADLEASWHDLATRAPFQDARAEKWRVLLSTPDGLKLLADLRRTGRFTDDIEHLSSLTRSAKCAEVCRRQLDRRISNELAGQQLHPPDDGWCVLSTLVDQSMGGLSKLIQACADAKPHLLVAHIYVWYMAVLSGGRYLMHALLQADASFWGHNNDTGSELGFSFLGADASLKTTLKAQLAQWDSTLTDEEKTEVVEETQRIYDLAIDLVEAFKCDVPQIVDDAGTQDTLASALQTDSGTCGESIGTADAYDTVMRGSSARLVTLSQGPKVPWLGDGWKEWMLGFLRVW